ncbi:hypothetical protein ZHAS_00015738 [Anopheles sinensis]|uniref:Uncharacterized protein n=1 Tax=Anopheles sinensis TaxID=74873 RepID=A0A084WBU6_ANOSI|nr:hypothetical protein ZHAS_00015738 [Anopheles sinensis]
MSSETLVRGKGNRKSNSCSPTPKPLDSPGGGKCYAFPGTESTTMTKIPQREGRSLRSSVPFLFVMLIPMPPPMARSAVQRESPEIGVLRVHAGGEKSG